MASVNEQILEETIRHAVGLQRYGSGIVKKIITLLKRTETDLVKKLIDFDLTPGRSEIARQRLQRLLDSVREIIQEGYNGLEPELRKELLELADYESEYQQKMLQTTVPVQLDLTTPTIEQLVAVVQRRPFNGALLSEWAARLEENTRRRVSDAISIGFTEGETVQQIVQRVRGTRANNYKDGILEVTRREAEAIVRTAVSHVANGARDELFRANTDVIKGWKFVATLDSKTTPVCRALDGGFYKVGEGPLPPRHINCRSTASPVTYSFKELGIDEEELPPSTRSSMDGQVPEDMTYGEWLRKRSRAEVEDIMGKTKAKLFLDGNLPLDRFVSRQGDELTIAELKKRDADAFRRAGLS
jgi:SPP1 gp7 family putative phage head morphogenesis protein